jgi:hypothetical protein
MNKFMALCGLEVLIFFELKIYSVVSSKAESEKSAQKNSFA